MRRVWAILLAVVMAVTIIPHLTIVNAEEKTIRIGYAANNPFIQSDNGRWTGYGVEYLDKIAEYTKWKYEYVQIEEENVEQELANGQIDFAFISSGRENQYARLLQSEFFAAYENYVIYTKEDTDIYYDDYITLNGSVIGIIGKVLDQNVVYDFLEENGVSYESRIYDSYEQLYAALEDGSVDAICQGNLTDCQGLRVISRFGTMEYYCFTSKANETLMKELNNAVKQLKYDDPGFEGELYESYYGHSQVSEKPMFTREEMEYVATAKPIKVKLMLGSVPLSYHNADGEPDGIFVDFFKVLEEKSGLTFEIQLETNPAKMEELTEGLVDGEYVMLRTEHAIEASSVHSQLRYSIPLVENHLSYIRRRDAVSDVGRTDYVFAITKDMKYIETLLGYYSKDFVIHYYDSTQECLNAVVKGEADIAIQDAYLMNYVLQKPIYADELAECPGREWINGMCVVAGEDDEVLLSIINKSIRHITNAEKESIPKLEILLNPYQLTFGDIFYQYHDVIVGVLILTVITLAIYTVLIRNITKVRIEMKDYKNLQKKIQEDELTGLYNRPYFCRRSREMINSSKEEMCIVLMNIVNFQVVNDIYSMEAGDLLLIEVAERFQYIGDKYHAIVGRFTGDRFYACLSVKDFYSMDLPRIFSSQRMDIDLKLNYGVFLIGEQKDLSIGEMCNRASIAAHNKDRKDIEYISYYSQEQHDQIIETQQMEAEMQSALKEGQFCAYIQPKYDVDSEQIIGGEALVRWKHPDKGMIPPYKFISVFEKNGFIVSLDYYVWEETCKYIASWKQRGVFKGVISVNVSRAHFYNRELVDKLLSLVAKYRLQPSDLQLEITETICSEENKMIYQKIQELRDYGFAVAMDDFGSGYSSLNMLKDIPLDIIKMDLKFLDGEGDQRKSRYILETLIRLAQNMRMKVVVEGVETEEQVAFLKTVGGVSVQGYYYSKPIEVEEYEKMLSCTQA